MHSTGAVASEEGLAATTETHGAAVRSTGAVASEEGLALSEEVVLIIREELAKLEQAQSQEERLVPAEKIVKAVNEDDKAQTEQLVNLIAQIPFIGYKMAFGTIDGFIYQGMITRRQHNILDNVMQYFYRAETIHAQKGFEKMRKRLAEESGRDWWEAWRECEENMNHQNYRLHHHNALGAMKKDGEPGQYIGLDKYTKMLSEIRNATTAEEAYRKVNEVEGISRKEDAALRAAVEERFPEVNRGARGEEEEDEDEKTSRVVPKDRAQDVGYLPGKVKDKVIKVFGNVPFPQMAITEVDAGKGKGHKENLRSGTNDFVVDDLEIQTIGFQQINTKRPLTYVLVMRNQALSVLTLSELATCKKGKENSARLGLPGARDYLLEFVNSRIMDMRERGFSDAPGGSPNDLIMIQKRKEHFSEYMARYTPIKNDKEEEGVTQKLNEVIRRNAELEKEVKKLRRKLREQERR